jgi:signal transduction histidine kinase
MRLLAGSLGYAVDAGFLLLAVKAIQELRVRRERRHAYLAAAIGSLAVLALASQLELAYPPIASVGGSIAVLSLMASAYGLLLFRGTFIPLRRGIKLAAAVTLAAAGLFAAVVPLLAPTVAPLQVAASVVPIAVWLVCAGEPTVRFWLASRGRPAVQRSRLRSLSYGYGGIVLILLLGLPGGAGNDSASGRLLIVVMWTIALAMMPLLYMAFWPPRWLRSRWRRSEAASFRGALEGLLMAATWEEAETAVVEWGMRRVGAAAGVLAADGRPLASAGLSAADAASLAAEVDLENRPETSELVLRGERLCLTLQRGIGQGPAVLVLLPGDFTPIFGADEMDSLRQFGVAATAALERLHLISQLTRANAAKSEFLSRMSHELRTPLNSVLGFSQLLAMDVVDPKQARRVGHINTAGTHLLALINDILDLSRIEAGQLSMSLQPVSVAPAVQQAVELIAPLADVRGLTIEVEPTPDEWFVLADPGRFSQVLINLLSNAVKYNRDSGRIRVFSELLDGERVRIHVTDTGIGIEPGQQALSSLSNA